MAAAAAATLIAAVPAWADVPLGYLRSFGPRARPVVSLAWGLLIISIVVVVIVSVLVVAGVWVRRTRLPVPIASVPVERGGNGLLWLYVGVGISIPVLFACLVWTVVVLAAVNVPARPPGLTIEVTGQQWWWKARYLSDDPSRVFTIADEIHIPVGEPVRITLIGADVIHSFWVPKLTGKTDAIPGLNNETWIQASRPGIYRGQCSEFCGDQHAHMGFLVVAQPSAAFAAWENAQVATPPLPTDPTLLRGLRSFEYRCGTCHKVRGTEAGGTVAPDLTHLMSRSILAGGVLTNTLANLSGWIADPQGQKPGTRMPNMDLSGPELHDITLYLETLR
jgi:cytochrome c oxidase subunit 2